MEISFTPDEEYAADAEVNFVPDDDYVSGLIKDPNFDPISYADENPNFTDVAKKVYIGKQQLPMTPERAIGLIPKVAKGAIGMVGDIGSGMANIGTNLVTQATTDDETVKQRARTEALTGAQLGEQNATHFLDSMFGKDSWLRRNIFSTTPDPARKAAPTDYDPNAEPPEARLARSFDKKLDEFRKTKQLTAGIPSDEGLVAKGVEALNKAVGVPEEEAKPSKTFMSGPEIEKEFGAGTGTDPETIATMAAAGDPTLALPLHVPGAATVAGVGLKAIGKGAGLADKGLSMAARSKIGRVARYGLGGAAGAAAVTHPKETAETLGTAAALYAGAKGARIVGKLFDTAGSKLINPKSVSATEKAAGQELIDLNNAGKGGQTFFSAKDNKADLERALAKPIGGAAQGAVGMAPIAAATSDSPEETASMIGGGAAFGGLAGTINHSPFKGFRPENIQAVDSILRENGKKGYGTELDKEHDSYIANLTPTERDGINSYRGFFQGFKLANGKEPEIYVLPADAFAREVAKHRPDVDPNEIAQQRGFASDDGKIFVNGDAGPAGGRTLGHEAGHVVENLLSVLQPELIKSMRASAEKGLVQDGKPTPELQKFIDEYNKQFDPTGKTKEIGSNEQAITEWLAEQASAVLEGSGPAKYAAGQSVRERIADNLGDYFKSLFGTKREFGREEIPAVADEYRQMLFELGRLRGKEPEPLPEPVVKVEPPPGPPPAEPAAVPADAPVAADVVNQEARIKALGVDPAAVDQARDSVINDALDNAKTKAGRRKTSDKSLDAVAKEAGDEFDQQLERYYAALEQEGVPHPEGLNLKEAVTINELALDQGGLPSWRNWSQLHAAESETGPAPRVVEEPLAGQESYPYEADPSEVQGLKERGWNDAEIAAMPESQVLRELNTPTQAKPTTTRPLERLGNDEAKPQTPTPPPSSPAETPEGLPLSQMSTPGVPSASKTPSTKTVNARLAQADKDPSIANARTPASKAKAKRAARLNALAEMVGEGDIIIDRQNPIHQAIIRELGYSGGDVNNVIDLQKNFGKGVVLRDYRSAAQEGFETGEGLDLSGSKRNIEYKASQTAGPGERQGGISKQDKGFTPYRVQVTKKGINILGFDHDKFLDNTRKILDAAAGKANTGFEEIKGSKLDDAVADAFSKVAENHANGYSGTGDPLPDSLEMPVNPDYTPHQVDADQAATINMAMHIRLQGAEVNPLRASLEAAGLNTESQLKPTISNIRPDLIEGGVHDTPSSGRSVHAHGFDIPAGKLTVKQAPHGRAVEAGFLPQKKKQRVFPVINNFMGREEYAEVIRNPSPREIKEFGDGWGAIIKDGDIFGWNRGKAYHSQVFAQALETKGGLPVIVYEGKPPGVLVTDASRNTPYWHSSKAAEVIRSIPRFKDAEISYYDEDIDGDWSKMDEGLLPSGFKPGGKDPAEELKDIQRQIDSLWYKKPRDETQIQQLRNRQSELLREQASDSAQKAAAKPGDETVVPSRPANELPEGHRVVAHWSPVEGLGEIDPSYHGKGRVGAERQRKAAFPDRYVDRSYFGYGDYKQETGTGKNRYAPDVDFRLLYDYASDPLDLMPLAVDTAGKESSDAAKITEYERLIKEHGYLGYYSDAAQAAALFHKIPAEGSVGGDAFAKSAPDYARRSPEMVRVLRDYVPNFDSIEDSYFQQRPADTEQVKKQNEIAKNYEAAKVDNLDDPKVKRAYDALVDKVNDQYDKVLKGIDVEPWADKQADGTWKSREGQPYKSSADMQEDIRGKKHLYFFITTPESFGTPKEGQKPFSETHPMFQQSGKTTKDGFPLMNNDILRAVHDAIAHGSFGVQFGPAGEEAAWRAHMATVNDPWARWALTTETRGQNSWVNYRDEYVKDGQPLKKGDPGYVSPTERPFADQKADLLDPKWMETGDPVVDEVIKDFNPDKASGFLPGKLKEYDELPDETKSDIEYWISEKIGRDETDVRDNLRDLIDPLMLKVELRDPKDIEGFERQTSQIAVNKYAKMQSNPPPILVDGDQFVDGGHRLQAALNSGRKIPVVDIGPILKMDWDSWLSGEEVDNAPTKSKLTGVSPDELKSRFLRGFLPRKLENVEDFWKEPKGNIDIEATDKLGKKKKLTVEVKGDTAKYWDGSSFKAFNPQDYNSISILTPGERDGSFKAGSVDARPQTEAEAEDNQYRISTRRPWGKGSGEDQGDLSVDAENILSNPGYRDKVAAAIKGYPYIKGVTKGTPEKALENVIEHARENLLWLHDKFPAELRDTAKLWYDGARKITEQWSKDYDLPTRAIAAAMASLSPQKDWFQNVSLAKRVIETVKDQQDSKLDPEMRKVAMSIAGTVKAIPKLLDLISNKPFKDLSIDERALWIRLYDEAHNDRTFPVISPDGSFMESKTKGDGEAGTAAWGSLSEIGKALGVIEDPSLENISSSMGMAHKVRNFYNNILIPNGLHGDVTIDTHALAAALLVPLAGADLETLQNFGSKVVKQHAPSGNRGTYGIWAEAYRRAAKDRDLLPREMQSITWEAIRGLFTKEFKRQKGTKDEIKDIWAQQSAGKITKAEAREKIFERAGGIKPPDWAEGRHRDEAPEKGGSASKPRDLSRLSVPGKSAEGVGRRGGAGAARELAGIR